MRVSEIVGQVAAWHLETFPNVGRLEIQLKLCDETLEVVGATDEELAEELADVCLVAFALAGRQGIDLETAIADKFAVNQKRGKEGRWK